MQKMFGWLKPFSLKLSIFRPEKVTPRGEVFSDESPNKIILGDASSNKVLSGDSYQNILIF